MGLNISASLRAARPQPLGTSNSRINPPSGQTSVAGSILILEIGMPYFCEMGNVRQLITGLEPMPIVKGDVGGVTEDTPAITFAYTARTHQIEAAHNILTKSATSTGLSFTTSAAATLGKDGLSFTETNSFVVRTMVHEVAHTLDNIAFLMKGKRLPTIPGVSNSSEAIEGRGALVDAILAAYNRALSGALIKFNSGVRVADNSRQPAKTNVFGIGVHLDMAWGEGKGRYYFTPMIGLVPMVHSSTDNSAESRCPTGLHEDGGLPGIEKGLGLTPKGARRYVFDSVVGAAVTNQPAVPPIEDPFGNLTAGENGAI